MGNSTIEFLVKQMSDLDDLALGLAVVQSVIFQLTLVPFPWPALILGLHRSLHDRVFSLLNVPPISPRSRRVPYIFVKLFGVVFV